jgi:hypothetical protein
MTRAIKLSIHLFGVEETAINLITAYLLPRNIIIFKEQYKKMLKHVKNCLETMNEKELEINPDNIIGIQNLDEAYKQGYEDGIKDCISKLNAKGFTFELIETPKNENN